MHLPPRDHDPERRNSVIVLHDVVRIALKAEREGRWAEVRPELEAEAAEVLQQIDGRPCTVVVSVTLNAREAEARADFFDEGSKTSTSGIWHKQSR